MGIENYAKTLEKHGCIESLTERGSHFIRVLVVERVFFEGGNGEGTWTEGTSPTHQVNASPGVSPIPRHWCDGQSRCIALSLGGDTQPGCELAGKVCSSL